MDQPRLRLVLEPRRRRETRREDRRRRGRTRPRSRARAPRRARRSGTATSPARTPLRRRGTRRRRRPRTPSAGSGSRRRRRARRPSSTVPPSRLPRSIASTISSNCDSLTIGPTSTSGSSGSPTRPRSIRASSAVAKRVVDRRPGRRCGASRCTSARPTRTRPRTRPRPPGRGRRRPSRSSGCGRRARAARACRCCVASSRTPWPVATEPVNEIARTRGSRTSAAPTVEPRPGEDVQHARRQLCLRERLGDVQAGARRLVGELEHDRVPVDRAPARASRSGSRSGSSTA